MKHKLIIENEQNNCIGVLLKFVIDVCMLYFYKYLFVLYGHFRKYKIKLYSFITFYSHTFTIDVLIKTS